MPLQSKFIKLKKRLMRNRLFYGICNFISNLLADNIIGISAQTAFFLLISLFPLVMTVVSILARLHIEMDSVLLAGIIPPSVVEIINEVLSTGRVSTTFTVVTLVLSLWSASAGIWALMKGICLSHIGRNPNYIRGRISSMFVTIVFMIVLVVSLAIWVFGQNILDWIQLYISIGDEVLTTVRYLFTLLFMFAFMVMLYRSAPGSSLGVKQTIPGAMIAAIGWGLVSGAYELYIRFVKDYAALYGGVGAFVGLAIWLMLISLVVLIGAEINSAIAGRKENKGDSVTPEG